ncbi:MAG: DUF1116 domain-containing protein [Clostridiaceae bacterium]|nr:DUF1116 domain-containing protein [Clostridiaceae bacterium]
MNNIKEQIDNANKKVMDILLNSQPTWVDVKPAGEVIPGFEKNMLLHPGPPIESVNEIVPALRTSLCGALVHEGLAETMDKAWEMIKVGEAILKPAQDYNASCAAVTVISASMPVIVGRDTVFGGEGYASLHPGPNPKCLRWGFYDEEVERDLAWYRDVFGPALGEAVRNLGGINIKTILSRTAGMGDENHVRQPAASNVLILDMIPALLDLKIEQRDDVIKAYAVNDRFFLHVMMAGVMGIFEKAKNVPMSTIMVAMGGNGTKFGLQFSGTGNKWFSTVAPKIRGQLLNPSWTEDDLAGYMGDSCVTEVYGFGGFSAIASPAFVRLTGGTFADAKKRTEDARAVSLGEHTFAPIPWDNYRGIPVGVDMRKVVATNIVPTSHGGSARLEGGQGGAGSVLVPLECFKEGLKAFFEMVGGK